MIHLFRKRNVMRNRIKIEMVYDYMKKNNLSKTKFCKMCKVSPAIFKKNRDVQSQWQTDSERLQF